MFSLHFLSVVVQLLSLCAKAQVNTPVSLSLEIERNSGTESKKQCFHSSGVTQKDTLHKIYWHISVQRRETVTWATNSNKKNTQASSSSCYRTPRIISYLFSALVYVCSQFKLNFMELNIDQRLTVLTPCLLERDRENLSPILYWILCIYHRYTIYRGIWWRERRKKVSNKAKRGHDFIIEHLSQLVTA